MSATKLLIQHPTTKKYAKGVGAWTSDTKDALLFQSRAAATAFSKSCKIDGVKIVAKPVKT